MSGFKEIVKSVDIRYKKKNSWHQVHTTQTNYIQLAGPAIGLPRSSWCSLALPKQQKSTVPKTACLA